MITLDTRQALLALLCEACDAGARWARACAQIGLNLRTVQRWQHPQAQHGDLRASDQRKPCTPPNKLSEAERLGALELLNSAEFKDLSPSQLVPRLADQGRYVASEAVLDELEGEGRVVFRYADNPNGSMRDIAGVSSANGRVVGLMPHPEHATEALTGPSDDGLGLFYSALDAVLATS